MISFARYPSFYNWEKIIDITTTFDYVQNKNQTLIPSESSLTEKLPIL